MSKHTTKPLPTPQAPDLFPNPSCAIMHIQIPPQTTGMQRMSYVYNCIHTPSPTPLPFPSRCESASRDLA